MDLSISMQSLKNVFRFPFQDPRWKIKFLIGAALAFAGTLVPLIPALPLMGYFARMMRAGARNDDAGTLPEWDNWGELFLDGLRQTVLLIIAFLPAAVISTIGWVIYMAAVVAMPMFERGGRSGEMVFTMLGSFGIFFLSMAISMVLVLITALVFPPAMAHVAVTRSLGSFFKVGTWWKVMSKNFLGFQVAIAIFGALYVLLVVVTQILYMTMILCVFIPFLLIPMGFYSGLVFYRLVGQAYGEAAPPADHSPLLVTEIAPAPAA